MDIKFRRSTKSTKTKEVFKRFVAIIIFGIIFIYGLIYLSQLNNAPVYIDVECKENAFYLVEGSMVSYDKFATSFMKSVHDKKQIHDSAQIKIRCYIPKTFTAGQINDILQIIQASHPIYELHIAK